MNSIAFETGRSTAAARPARTARRFGPIWARSLAAGPGSAVAMATLMVNLTWLPWISLATALLLTLLLAFPLWVALAYYCYSARSLTAAWRALGLLALPSILLNIALYAR